MDTRLAKSSDPPNPNGRNGKLRIPLPFEDALKAAVETRPPEKSKKKRPAKKR